MASMLPLIGSMVFFHVTSKPGPITYIILDPITRLTYLGEESGIWTFAEPHVKNVDPLVQHKWS